MSDARSIQWLQSIESSLQAAYADLTALYDRAPQSERPPIYAALAKLNERLKTVHSMIIDVLQERIPMNAPSAATIAQTRNLTDQLQWLVTQVNQYSAILTVLSDLSNLITRTIVEPVM